MGHHLHDTVGYCGDRRYHSGQLEGMECHWGLLWTNDTSTVVYCKELDVIGVLSGFPDASFISTFTLYHSPLSPSSFHPSIYPFSPYRGHFNPFLPNIPFY